METRDLIPIVEAAVRAPSVHNTQPWRFAIEPGDMQASIDLFADRSRLLPVADPNGRELHISCGAAIEFARVQARAMAFACRVELMPDPSAPDHLASLLVEGQELPTANEIALAQALGRRYTERGRFDDEAVPTTLIDRLRECVVPFEAWLKVLDAKADQTVAAVLLALADEIESSSGEYQEEAAGWTRETPGEADGVAAYLEAEKLSGRASSFKLRHLGATPPAGATAGADEPPPAPEHPLVALLGTPGDDPYYWLQAGRALGRLLLTATDKGVAASPMTQVLEIESTRALLARELGLLGHPQVLLRMGFAHGEPTSLRRPVEEVLIASPGHGPG